MEKRIVDLSYWLGLLSAVIALILRGLNALAVLVPAAVEQKGSVYMSFYKGALLFFLIAIATAQRLRVVSLHR